MKKVALFTSLWLALSLAFISHADNEKIIWHPQCRHNALYWAITVSEQFPTRIMYGHFENKEGKVTGYHVQPQVRVGENWYYFKVENDNVVFIFDMNEWTENKEDIWVPTYVFHDYGEYITTFEKWKDKKDE